ncbi:MAG TPA: hypothetical protein VG273_21700 [Bryobacteraceae bacterium]|jgi:hypothetical protein|nr:hypothetical protein [Bryobacteraceae bacterium]
MREMAPAAPSGKADVKARPLTPDGIARLVDKAIRSFEDTLDSTGGKCSVGDLVRLLQLRKELAGDTPGNVTVRWVDECNETSNDI